MPLSEDEREIIEMFRDYVAGAVAADDRYGPATRHDQEDESTLALRFEPATACWFEVAVRPFLPQIRVAFVTRDQTRSEEIEQAVAEAGGSLEAFVGEAFRDAGLDWPDPPVEHYREPDGLFYFATPLEAVESQELDDFTGLVDLEHEQIRGRILRMLEGYLIAFGPAIEPEDDE